MILPVMAGPQTLAVSARNWIRVRSDEPNWSAMMMALYWANCWVVMDRHSVSVTVWVVYPRLDASDISSPCKVEMNRRSGTEVARAIAKAVAAARNDDFIAANTEAGRRRKAEVRRGQDRSGQVRTGQDRNITSDSETAERKERGGRW